HLHALRSARRAFGSVRATDGLDPLEELVRAVSVRAHVRGRAEGRPTLHDEDDDEEAHDEGQDDDPSRNDDASDDHACDDHDGAAAAGDHDPDDDVGAPADDDHGAADDHGSDHDDLADHDDDHDDPRGLMPPAGSAGGASPRSSARDAQERIP